jgi:hypothetical protein
MQGRGTAPEGGYYALVIGNNDYASLPKLKTAKADASEVERLLRESYGFRTKLLLNATRQQIVSALFSYRQTLGPDANLLVYYAGHGINDKDADKSYWLPVDAARDDDSNWISADDITTRIRAIPARHVLVISDSCYSGTLTRGLGESLPPPNAREQFLQRMAAGRSRTLMASGGDEPVADSGSGGHSVFAAALLRGLREMDKGKFTAAELFRLYVQEPVAGRAQQMPEYNPLRNSGHESGDFVFVKIKTDGKNVEVTVNAPPPASVDPAAIELSFWESIKASTDAEDFKAYLDSYPSGRFAALARNNIRRLEAAKSAPPPTGKTPTDSLPAGNAATENAPAPKETPDLEVVPSGWRRFTPPEGHFSILLPSEPARQSNTVNSSSGPYTTHLFTAKSNGEIYLAGWVDYDPRFNFGVEAELKANRDNFIKAVKARLTGTTNITFLGYPALEFTASNSQAFFKSRVIIVGRRPYQLIVVATGGGSLSADAETFLSSFKIGSQ